MSTEIHRAWRAGRIAVPTATALAAHLAGTTPRRTFSRASTRADDRPRDALEEALEALMKLAEGDDDDARRARLLLVSYFDDGVDDEDPTPTHGSPKRAPEKEDPMSPDQARARAEALIRNPDTSERDRRELQALLRGRPAPRASQLSDHEQRRLDSMDRDRPNAATAHCEGASLVLTYCTPAVAAARARELAGELEGSRPYTPSIAQLDARITRLAGGL